MINHSKRKSMLALVKTKHGHQTRNGTLNTPYWEHCYGVAKLLDEFIDKHCPNLPDETKDIMYLAGLGHDLYEDTDVERQAIIKSYGPEVDGLIDAVTNDKSDFDRADYLHKLENASDQAMLIKFADFINNTSSVVENQDYFEKDWIREFFWPIAQETRSILESHQFDNQWKDLSIELQAQTNAVFGKLQTVLGIT